MKNVQISEELFRCDNEIFYVGAGEMLPQIKQGLEKETGCNGDERIIYKIWNRTNRRRKRKGTKGIPG